MVGEREADPVAANAGGRVGSHEGGGGGVGQWVKEGGGGGIGRWAKEGAALSEDERRCWGEDR